MYNVPRGIIVSIQDTFSEESFGIEAWAGGAVAIRTTLAYPRNTSKPLPIILLVKDDERRITPTEDYVKCCLGSAPDYIATGAVVYGTDIRRMLPNMIADIATVDQAVRAEELGYCAVTTALSGYTDDYRCKEGEGPDLNLVEDIADKLTIPVIAEGRYFTTDQVRVAFDAGAHSVCIGGAITRPDLITKRFVKAAAV